MTQTGPRMKASLAPATAIWEGETWLLVAEAARRLQVSTPRVYQLTKGRLATWTSSLGLIYVRQRDVMEYQAYREQLAKLRRTGRPLGGYTTHRRSQRPDS